MYDRVNALWPGKGGNKSFYKKGFELDHMLVNEREGSHSLGGKTTLAKQRLFGKAMERESRLNNNAPCQLCSFKVIAEWKHMDRFVQSLFHGFGEHSGKADQHQ